MKRIWWVVAELQSGSERDADYSDDYNFELYLQERILSPLGLQTKESGSGFLLIAPI